MSDEARSGDDVWKRWLLHGRDVTDQRRAGAQDHFRQIRDRVLQNAKVREGDTLLDVGTGTGLIAFGALEKVGPKGRVIFSDISRDCLQHCRSLTAELNASAQSEFVEASIDDLEPISDASVDVVTTRSVIIYTANKKSAFNAFFRVLKPGGRLSMFEPVNRFGDVREPPGGHRFRGYDISEVWDLAQPVMELMARHVGSANDAMSDFDERDLLEFALDAGFGNVTIEYVASVGRTHSQPWDFFYKSAPNPLALSVEQAAVQVLTDTQRMRFESVLQKAVATQTVPSRRAFVYVVAAKDH